jgi:multidrug efflux pump subunit AcrB
MLAKLRTVSGLLDVNSDQQNKGLQAGLVIDRETAARLGITAQMIDNTLYDAWDSVRSLRSTLSSISTTWCSRPSRLSSKTPRV